MRVLLLIIFAYSCSPKYEIVEEIHPGMYHTEGVKKKDIILYKTNEKFKSGDIVIIPKKIKKKNADN